MATLSGRWRWQSTFRSFVDIRHPICLCRSLILIFLMTFTEPLSFWTYISPLKFFEKHCGMISPSLPPCLKRRLSNVSFVYVPEIWFDKLTKESLEVYSLYFHVTEFQSKEIPPQRSRLSKKFHRKEISQERSVTAKKSHIKEISQQRSLTAKRSHSRSLTAKKSHSKEVSQQGSLTARKSHSKEISHQRRLTAQKYHSKESSQLRSLTAKKPHGKEVSQQPHSKEIP